MYAAMTASPPRAPGRFVVLVGPDGVGKTTVARTLLAHYAGPGAYFHFLPPVVGPLGGAPAEGLAPPPKAAPGGGLVLGWLRLLRNSARCWVGYLTAVRPALNRRWLVVGDRWMYGYLVQPASLRYRGPDALARLVMRLLPRPHLVVNLAAPADVIRRRKHELSVSEIERELIAWSSLPLANMRTFDATRAPHEIATEVLATLSPGAVHRANAVDHT
jgi:thymidylate kinase